MDIIFKTIIYTLLNAGIYNVVLPLWAILIYLQQKIPTDTIVDSVEVFSKISRSMLSVANY